MKDCFLPLASPQSALALPSLERKTFAQTSSVFILGKDAKVAHFLASSLELSGLNTRVLTHWEKTPHLLGSASLIILLLKLNVSVNRMKQLCQEIRGHTECSIMILSDEFQEAGESRVSLKKCEVLVDPIFSENVVEQVMKAIQGSKSTTGQHRVMEHGDLRVNHQKRKVTVGGREVTFTPSEYKLLYVLMGSPGQVFFRDELLDVLYEREGTVIDRVIDVHIGKVRRKIEANPARPQHILTVRGIGYKFSDRNFNG